MTFGPHLDGRRCLHFIDNSSAFYSLLHASSQHGEMWRLTRLYHAFLLSFDTSVHFEMVASADNISDVPSRGPTHPGWQPMLELGFRRVALRFPSEDDWDDVTALLARPTSPVEPAD
mmetsp:Transcript_35522/g.89631  ORF Transcript_35522/g.89631 Transcript_35522/m.89631 type:complete len:117 (+) Transcript_35522:932-1282(+)